MNWERCPDWGFGQVVRFTQDRKCRAMVLGWDYRVDYNPSESIVVLLAITLDIEKLPVGTVFKPYCGWWEPVDV